MRPTLTAFVAGAALLLAPAATAVPSGDPSTWPVADTAGFTSADEATMTACTPCIPMPTNT
jgi:hypothetical protein